MYIVICSKKGKHFGCHSKSSQSIFFGPTFKLRQRRLILSPFPLKTRRPPPPLQDLLTPPTLFPSEKWWPFPYFCSALSEKIKFMISYLSIFLIWDWRMLWILQILPKSKAIKWSCKKKTSFGIRPMWGVVFLSLILSLFQMIILPSSDVDKRGWDSAYPAFSCKEILDSGNSKGDGEYWINPEKSGNPLRVYCDRSRYGGKWISLFIWDTRNLIGVYLTWSSFY